MMKTLLLSDDLMLSSQATQTARTAGGDVQVLSQQQILRECASLPSAQVILDLNTPLANLAEFVSQIRDSGCEAKIVAVAPHVHTAKIEAARAAGCDVVLTKGQFHASMAELLAASE